MVVWCAVPRSRAQKLGYLPVLDTLYRRAFSWNFAGRQSRPSSRRGSVGGWGSAAFEWAEERLFYRGALTRLTVANITETGASLWRDGARARVGPA